MIPAVLLLGALAMPRLEDGAETYEHLEGLLGGTLLDFLAPSPALSSEYREVAASPAPSSEYREVAASPTPRSWTEWVEVWSSPGAATTRLAQWTAKLESSLVIMEAERPAQPSVKVEWDKLMAECAQNPDRYAKYLGGALTTGDVLAQVPGVLERCAVHEATCGFSLVVCNWLRDETIPFNLDWPAQRNEQTVIYYQSCDCLLLLLFVVLSTLACASCKPRPLVVEAEPVKV